jgi:signal transduction histidine kinase
MKLENHFKEMLTATVSHEMRTPLNAIIGLLSTLEHFVPSNEGKRLLKVINSSAQILLYLVNDMLDIF